MNLSGVSQADGAAGSPRQSGYAPAENAGLFQGFDRQALSEGEKRRLSDSQRNFYDAYWTYHGKPPPARLVEECESVKTFRGAMSVLLKGETAYRMGGRWLVHTDRLAQWTGGKGFIGVPPSLVPYQRPITMDVALDIMLWAKAEGWKSVTLHGNRKDKEALWLAAKQVGLKIRDDYHPSRKMVAQWEAMIPDVVQRKLAEKMDEARFAMTSEMSHLNLTKLQRIMTGIEALQEKVHNDRQALTLDDYQQINDALDNGDYGRAFSFGLGADYAQNLFHGGANPSPGAQSGGGADSITDDEKDDLKARFSVFAQENGMPAAEFDQRFEENIRPFPVTTHQRDEALDLAETGEFENALSILEMNAGPRPRPGGPAASPDPAPGLTPPMPGEPMASDDQKTELRELLKFWGALKARSEGGGWEIQDRFDRNVAPHPMTLRHYEAATQTLIKGDLEGAMSLIEKKPAPAARPSRQPA